MKRRTFLRQSTLAGLSVGLGLKSGAINPISSPLLSSMINPDSDKVLVLVQLTGGNDGLNTIIPMDQYSSLSSVRSNILIPESETISITDTLALHPRLETIAPLFLQGKMTIVQDVGYPDQNRSHFRSLDIWTSGSPAAEYWTTGWVGRYLDSHFPDYPNGFPNADHPDPFALSLGASVIETCQGIASNYSVVVEDPFALSPLSEPLPSGFPDTNYDNELTFLKQMVSQTNSYNDTISNAANLGTNMVVYPDSGRLSDGLATTARLISGGLKTKVYVVRLGGFDTHANQVKSNDPTDGDHANLLLELSEALAAFQQDLQLQGLEDRVITMTFSEFGRRIRSNASYGTDHGTAAPMLFFGSCVQPGIIGSNPVIDDQVGVQDGVPMQYDFRDVYGSVLVDWFEVAVDDVKQMLNPDFQYIPILNPCGIIDHTIEAPVTPTNLAFSPNPTQNSSIARFSSETEYVKLSLFDPLGREVRVFHKGILSQGEHNMTCSLFGLTSGPYYLRLSLENGKQQILKVVIQ